MRTFHNGVLHIDAPLGRAFLSWLVDTAVVAGTSVVIAAAALMAAGEAPDSASVAVAVAAVLIVGLPFLYGWYFRNGRALGGVLTGTRLVRLKGGNRSGSGQQGSRSSTEPLAGRLRSALVA